MPTLRGSDKRLMQTILVGGIDTRERKFVRRQAQHPMCLHCNQQVVETTGHIVSDCPAWQPIRQNVDNQFFHEQLCPCVALNGIIPEQPHYAANERLLEETNETPNAHFAANEACETWADNRIVIFTDGACKRNSHKRLRRAGCGIFFGPGHTMNMSLPVPGRQQSNQRAELLAAIKAAETDPRDIEIRSDSAYVVRGLMAPSSWRMQVSRVNGDLWARVDALVTASPNRILVTKVKGHATWRDVAQQTVSYSDKVGNAEADRLARAGADQHASVLHLEQSSQRRIAKTRQYHKCLLRIMKARARALGALPEHITAPPQNFCQFARNVRRRLQ